MAQTLQQLTAGFPPSLSVPASAVAQVASDSARILVVLDDDPTGTQSVADLPVLTDWTVESLAWGLGQGRPAIYVMTNSRSVDPDVAERRNREVADAASRCGRTPTHTRSIAADELIGYLERQSHRMDPPEYLARGGCLGAGRWRARARRWSASD